MSASIAPSLSIQHGTYNVAFCSGAGDGPGRRKIRILFAAPLTISVSLTVPHRDVVAFHHGASLALAVATATNDNRRHDVELGGRCERWKTAMQKLKFSRSRSQRNCFRQPLARGWGEAHRPTAMRTNIRSAIDAWRGHRILPEGHRFLQLQARIQVGARRVRM